MAWAGVLWEKVSPAMWRSDSVICDSPGRMPTTLGDWYVRTVASMWARRRMGSSTALKPSRPAVVISSAVLGRPEAAKSLSAMAWVIQEAAATCGLMSPAREVFSPDQEFWTTDHGERARSVRGGVRG